MKRLFTALMTAVLLFSVTGCSSEKNNGGETTDSDGSTIPQSTENQDGLPGSSHEASGSKILVVYYSATGTTEKVAKSMAGLAGADVFVIEPEREYTSDDLDWNDKSSRVSTEHDHPENRDVKLKTVNPDHFESYDTILLGYPIWWGIAAWPVDTFVKGNDFTGKTVIPFCTAASSDIGESGNFLADMAGTGEWMEGRRFYNTSSEEEIRDWLKNLNLN